MTPSPATAGGLVRAARPRQWLKNLLVVAAPAGAGVLADPDVVWRVAVAFAAFCLAASGTYLVNDCLDAEADRLHPRKRHRPVAAGQVTPRTAVVTGIVLLAAGLATSLAAGPALTMTVAVYVAVTMAYSTWLRRIPVIDLVAVAAGFFLRALAGGVAADVPLSEWFLIVAWFGALFVVAGKRHADHLRLGDERGAHRSTLEAYGPAYTQHVLTLSSVVAVLAYCLWAFETQAGQGGAPWLAISILPFTVVFLRYALLVLAGEGGEPEELVLGDRTLLGAGVVWVLSLLSAGWLG